MHISRPIILLKSLSPSELKNFSKFISSPYFNTNPYLVKYYEILKKHYPEFDSPKLEKREVFKKLYPKKKYNDELMRKNNSLLKKHIEKYLIINNLEKKKDFQTYLLAEEYGKRGLYSGFEKGINSLLEKSTATPFKNMTEYLKLFWLHRAIHFHPDTFRNTVKIDHIQELDKNLDLFYALAKLKFGGELLNRNKLLPGKQEVAFLSDIMNRIENGWGREQPLISIYFLLIKLLQEQRNDVLFLELKKEITDNIAEITKEDQAPILLFLLNYTMSVYYNGDARFLTDQFELYQLGLNNGVLVQGGNITDQTFLNIVTTACVIKEFDWAEKFVEIYEEQLEVGIRADVSLMSKAYLLFHQGKYSAANKLLQTFQTTHVNLLLRSRFLWAINQCEVFFNDGNLYQPTIHHIEAFEKFIRRNKELSQARKTQLLNFVRFVKKIIHSHIKTDKKKNLLALKKEIENTTDLPGKHWLLSKAKLL